jgi:hypothetical protein
VAHVLVARLQHVFAGIVHPAFGAANTISNPHAFTDVDTTNADLGGLLPAAKGGVAEHAPADASVPDAAAASAKTRVVAMLIALALSLFILLILSGMCNP